MMRYKYINLTSVKKTKHIYYYYCNDYCHFIGFGGGIPLHPLVVPRDEA